MSKPDEVKKLYALKKLIDDKIVEIEYLEYLKKLKSGREDAKKARTQFMTDDSWGEGLESVSFIRLGSPNIDFQKKAAPIILKFESQIINELIEESEKKLEVLNESLHTKLSLLTK